MRLKHKITLCNGYLQSVETPLKESRWGFDIKLKQFGGCWVDNGVVFKNYPAKKILGKNTHEDLKIAEVEVLQYADLYKFEVKDPQGRVFEGGYYALSPRNETPKHTYKFDKFGVLVKTGSIEIEPQQNYPNVSGEHTFEFDVEYPDYTYQTPIEAGLICVNLETLNKISLSPSVETDFAVLGDVVFSNFETLFVSEDEYKQLLAARINSQIQEKIQSLTKDSELTFVVYEYKYYTYSATSYLHTNKLYVNGDEWDFEECEDIKILETTHESATGPGKSRHSGYTIYKLLVADDLELHQEVEYTEHGSSYDNPKNNHKPSTLGDLFKNLKK